MLSEWHLPPDYIVNNWTNELLTLMTDKLVERRMGKKESPPDGKVSDTELFSAMGKSVKVIKHGD